LVLWAQASNTARLEQSFREIAEILKVRGHREHQADIFKLVHDWLRDERNGRWLLVVDNADDVGVLSARADNSQNPQTDGVASADNSGSMLHHHLSTYLPQSRHGSVLLTSRSRQAAIQVVEDSDIIPIEPMDATAAHTLLRKNIGDEANNEGVDDSINELAVALDHMPLALEQAAAYIRRRAPRCSVQQYLEEFKQSDHRAASLLNHEAGHLRRDISASNAILLTWQISFDHVRSIRRSAANLLSLMSFFDRQGIPEDLLYGYDWADEDENEISFHNDLNTLRDFFFVTVTKDPGRFEMQSLVQLATRKWLESQDQLERWREQFISNLCAKLPNGDYENWERCQALFPHAKAAMTQRPRRQTSLKEWASLLHNAGRYAYTVGRLDEAEDMLVLSKDVINEVYGEENANTLDSMELVGLVIGSRGNYKDAETIHSRILAIRTKVLGREHPDTLGSKNNIGFCLQQQGRNKEAEAIHRQTLATAKIVLGHEHPATLDIRSNLAEVLNQERKFKEAEAMHRKVLAMKEKVKGHKHPSTSTSVYSLAGVLAEQGSYSESLALYDRACAGFLDAFGMDNLRTRRCYEDRSRAESLRQAQSSARADASESAHTTKLASPSISAPQAQASDQSPHSIMGSLEERSKESSKLAELQPL
jgi:tetratricopeptide (TPR) repeat protein